MSDGHQASQPERPPRHPHVFGRHPRRRRTFQDRSVTAGASQFHPHAFNYLTDPQYLGCLPVLNASSGVVRAAGTVSALSGWPWGSATLGSFGKWMLSRDKLVRNPVDRLTRPRRKARVPAVPTWNAVKASLQQCRRREWAILAPMAFGGLRRGEVAALNVGDVAPDFGLRRVVGKGGHELLVALPLRLEPSCMST